MHRSEIQHKFDAIVDFAEVEKFIDTPVKHYSSGMYVRLAFAVAAHLDPEILLVDEVLSVGDIAFQKKSFEKMSELTTGGRTVLFVSHNMSAIRRICHCALVLEKGEIITQGEVNRTVEAYLQVSEEKLPINRKGNGKARVVEALITQNGAPISHIGVFEDINIELKIEAVEDIEECIIGIKLIGRNGDVFFSTNSDVLGMGGIPLKKRGVNQVNFLLHSVPLQNGDYSLTAAIVPAGDDTFITDYYDRVENIAGFSIFSQDNQHGLANIKTEFFMTNEHS
jgi:lipopolysaccharide transport system ATP-binding protein